MEFITTDEKRPHPRSSIVSSVGRLAINGEARAS